MLYTLPVVKYMPKCDHWLSYTCKTCRVLTPPRALYDLGLLAASMSVCTTTVWKVPSETNLLKLVEQLYWVCVCTPTFVYKHQPSYTNTGQNFSKKQLHYYTKYKVLGWPQFRKGGLVAMPYCWHFLCSHSHNEITNPTWTSIEVKEWRRGVHRHLCTCIYLHERQQWGLLTRDFMCVHNYMYMYI